MTVIDGYVAVDDEITDPPPPKAGRGAELTARIEYTTVDYDPRTGRGTRKASSITVTNEASETVAREVKLSLSWSAMASEA